MVQLRFIGSGDAFGSGGRFNTCLEVRAAASVFLIDLGATSLVAMNALGVQRNPVRTILFSHLHGDHFGGLPFFLLDAQFVSGRKGPLTFAGPPGMEERVMQALDVFFPGAAATAWNFPLDFVELAPGRPHRLEGFAVRPFVVDHPSGAPSFALRVEVDGKTLCYSGDTAWTKSLADAARGADLFVTETYSLRMPVPFHLDLPTLKRHLPGIGAKRTILTHLGPEMLAHAAEAGIEVAHDGMAVEV